MSPALSRNRLLALLAVFTLAWFCTLGYRHLVKPDEGRYAEIPREMIASGDWLTPRLDGLKYFEKPALQYWMTAVSFKLFGQTEWAARLWTALTGFLGALLVFFAGKRLFGPPSALFGATVIASSLMYAFVGHVLTLDMTLAFFLSLSVFAVALAQQDGADASTRRTWMLTAWAAAALAVLTKGLIGFVLPAAAIGLYMLIERDWKLISRLHVVSGTLLFLAIAAPWFIAVSRANPEFFHFFFIHEHFERFLTKEHGRYQPMWYFIPVLLLGLVPWTVSLFPAVWQSAKRAPGKNFQPQRFLLAWIAVVFVFFSASSSKLAPYILPIYPAMALLIGRYLANAPTAVSVGQAVIMIALGILGAFAAPGALSYAEVDRLPEELLAGYVPWLIAAGIALAAGAALAAWLGLRKRALAAAISLAVGGMAATELVLSGHEQLSPVYSAYHIVRKIQSQIKPDAPFYFVNTFDHTLLFYLGRTVTMVAYKDELDKSVEWEPGKFIPNMDEFARVWQTQREAYAMFSPEDFDAFIKKHPVAMQEIARGPNRVVVKKP